jgi:TPR repeat protein
VLAPADASDLTTCQRIANCSSRVRALLLATGKKARELVELGDVASARLMLARAAEGKDSRALVALAGTYDPVVLRRWRVVGMRPDPDRARALYQQALEQGSKTASEHLLALK